MTAPTWEAEHGHQAGRCRECGAELKGRRRSWCSDECVQLYMVRAHPSHARRAVYMRDGGVCAECALDTEELARRVDQVTTTQVARWNSDRGKRWDHGFAFNANWPERLRALARTARENVLEPYGWAHLWRRRSWWDADHIVPLAAGGESVMANLQTLCVGCHQAKTAAARPNLR